MSFMLLDGNCRLAKGTDLSVHSQTYLNKVAHLISALDWISAGTTEAASVR